MRATSRVKGLLGAIRPDTYFAALLAQQSHVVPPQHDIYPAAGLLGVVVARRGLARVPPDPGRRRARRGGAAGCVVRPYGEVVGPEA
eukprot:scaffold491241_cov36-Prasinocladus_malaysianus.AAC.1